LPRAQPQREYEVEPLFEVVDPGQDQQELAPEYGM
jgi:hypothetical protein